MGRLLLITISLLFSTNLLFGQGSYLNIMGIIRGDSLGSQFGKKVVPAGDVNGDSIPDFLVGSFSGDPIYPYSGPVGAQKVGLFLGKSNELDTIPDSVIQHKAQLEALGDINGDGDLDYIMRESGQNYRLSIYFGGSVLDTIPDGYVKGDSSDWISDAFGNEVSAGKLSSIGDGQIIVGKTMPRFDSVRFCGYNVTGNMVDSLPFWKLDLVDRVGFSAGPAVVVGDINGGGYADLAIGRATGVDTDSGKVEIYFGASAFDTLPDLVLWPPPYLTGLAAGDFGEQLAAAGDLDNDGLGEFVVGSGGVIMVYFGGTPFDTLPKFRLDRPGSIFANGGDINADGFNDLLVGRPQPPITGYAYVYYGGPAMDSIVDLEIKEVDLPYPASGFGQTVAGLGDIDKNGSNDFAIGSTSNTDPDRGYLWVFNGPLPSTGVTDEKKNLPKKFELEQNYPNPFNSTTQISYTLSRRADVRLEIFNIAGQLVKTLVDEEQSAGSHQISWRGEDSKGKPMPSGIYLYKLSFEGEVQVKKMVLVK